MNLSKLLSCKHCGNISKMEIVGNITDYIKGEDPEFGYINFHGTKYSVLKCPACCKINIVSYFWHDAMESDEEITYDLLFPADTIYPVGLPEKISDAFKAAEKAKSFDVNAYAILTRKLLELVCLDRGAKKDWLAKMLRELANAGEIPEKLVEIASKLKDFGNIGAHAGSGDLTLEEIPIVNALSIAILEYVYSAPFLATEAENRLNEIKNKIMG
jgi:hypothetical protein